ncbi:MAG: YCF48-related protein [bacterium]
MKLAMVSAVLAFGLATAHAEWVQQGPFPTHADTQSIEFVSATEGWLLSNDGPDGGEIWHTIDGGASWTRQFFSDLYRFQDLDMVDASVGFAIGHELRKTTDGGATWDFANLPPLGVQGNYIQMVSTTHGWLSTRPSGPTNYLYRTVNGGLSWDYLGEYWVGPWMFADETTGWAIDTAQRAIRTTDGGFTWAVIGDPSGISIDSGIHYAFSADRVIVRTFDFDNFLRYWITENGGATWTPVVGNPGVQPVFRDANEGYSAFQYDVVGTTDGGFSWSTVGAGVGAKWLTTVALRGPTDLVAGGGYGFLTERVGSGPWTQISNGSGELLRDVAFATPTKGWAVGDGFGLLETFDAGDTWRHVLLPGTRRDLLRVTAVSANRAFVRAASGHFVTTDGGATWLEAITWPEGVAYFRDETTGWLIEQDHQTFHKTTDGGASWSTQTVTGLSGTTDLDLIHAIQFVNDDVGYIAARWDLIFRTTDGGATWNVLPHPPTVGGDYRLLAFADANRGWVAGSFGAILHTTDGGATWVNETLSDFSEILDLHVVDPTRAMVCGGRTGGFGFIRESVGGSPWTTVYSNPDLIQYGVFERNGAVWTCGTDGRMDHFAPASTSVGPPVDHSILSLSASPNPAPRSMTIQFRLPQPGRARVEVFDVQGRAVRVVAERVFPSGANGVTWDGRNEAGERVASGRYFVRIASPSGDDTVPVVVLR